MRLIKKVIPSFLWNYLKKRKDDYVISQLRRFIPSFLVLGSWQEQIELGRFLDGEQYYSQALQDYFIDKYVFKRKQGGFFLDIGGNDPVKINNTYFFEKTRGWSGLAFEPMKTQNDKWKSERNIECLQCALGSSNGEIEFCEYEDHYMSGFSTEVDYKGKVKTRYTVQVRRLADILEERGITHVDFVSLDVEGAELGVLNGIDFNKVDITCFTIENNKGPERERRIIRFMLDHGYKIKARLWLDDLWVKA
ncbi:MAG: FkbM family methyltransferase [Synergistaceae bacterium]|nr:FkbM family methyltransferase [Synergistaceae bacterium]